MKEKEYKTQPEESKVEEPATAYGLDAISLEELRQATIDDIRELKDKYSFKKVRDVIASLKSGEEHRKKDLPYPWCPSPEQLRREIDKEMEDYYNGVPGYTLEETLREIKK